MTAALVGAIADVLMWNLDITDGDDMWFMDNDSPRSMAEKILPAVLETIRAWHEALPQAAQCAAQHEGLVCCITRLIQNAP